MQLRVLRKAGHFITRGGVPMFRRPSKVVSTTFSDFIRNAPSRENKRVYAKVLKGTLERQRKQVEQVQSASDNA